MEMNGILLPSQDEFREHYRTNNNMFILRTATDQSRVNDTWQLYVAFVDLVNAFPSMNQPTTLWAKMTDLGAGGPIMDWLHMMYPKIEYVVKLGPYHSDAFQLIMGILAGDSSSPDLWNIYFSDFSMPRHRDDFFFCDCHVSHIEQADDIALFSISVESLQSKLDALFDWCRQNSMTISKGKTKVWIAGRLHRVLPTLTVGGRPLKCVARHKYVGITLSSTDRVISKEHYYIKASKARKSVNALFGAKNFVGTIPPQNGIFVYTVPHWDLAPVTPLPLGNSSRRYANS